MIWAALNFALGWARGAFSWLTASSSRLLIAALCIAILWGWAGHRSAAKWKGQATEAQTTLTHERAQAEAVKAKAEADYRSKAHAADVSYQAGLAQGDARLAAYIASHRMRPAQAHPASPAQGDGARLPEVAPTETVLAEVTDLKVCDMNYSYALAAHEWAMKLEGMPHD